MLQNEQRHIHLFIQENAKKKGETGVWERQGGERGPLREIHINVHRKKE